MGFLVTDTLDNDTTAKLFADDLKLYTHKTTSSTHNLQHQLNNICLWSNAWQLPISFSKCTIFTLARTKINSSTTSKIFQLLNLFIRADWPRHQIDPNLRFSNHVQAIVSRARNRSAQIIRCFLSRNISLMTRAFITYVRPTLEYASTIWSPSRITQIIFIEGVQRSFIKRLPGLFDTLRIRKICIFRILSVSKASKTAKPRAPSTLTSSRSNVWNIS